MLHLYIDDRNSLIVAFGIRANSHGIHGEREERGERREEREREREKEERVSIIE